MKRTLSLVLSLIMILSIFTSMPVTVNAASVDDLTFTLNDDGKSYSVAACKVTASGQLIIPDIYSGKPVTSIELGAFSGCTSLESVTLGNGVKSIDEWAFSDCISLSSITIPDNVTYIYPAAFQGCINLETINVNLNNKVYCSIDGVMFNKKGTKLVLYPGGKTNGSYSIPNGVTSIASWAFESCTKLISLIVPDSLTSIDDWAFSGCTSLKSITIPNSVTNIGYGAFENCRSLTSITIPNSVTSIGSSAFANCKSLATITIPDSVTNIDLCVFSNCTSLTSITIPDSVTSIGQDAFSGCTNLTSVTIGNSVKNIGFYAFEDCLNLISIVIPDSVTSISPDAFYNTGYYNNSSNWQNDVLYIGNHLIKAKKTISGNYAIRNGTKTIACHAFAGCTSLVSLNIPDGVICIEPYAFAGCINLACVIVPDSVTTIDEGAFNGCTSLTQTYYCGTKTQWDDIYIVFFNDALLENIVYNYNPNKIVTPKVKAVNTIKGMNVSWNVVPGAVKYALYKRLGTESAWTYVTTTTGTSYVDNNTPLAGSYYVYTVKAYDSAGISSDYIKVNCASVQRIITPRVSATNALNGINITWEKASGATKYNVYRRVGGSSSWVLLGSPTSTSFVDKNIKNGTYYVYSIRAVNGANISAFDTNKTDTIQPITAPTAVATNLANGVQVKWNSVTSATKYNVYRRVGGSSSWVLVGTTTGTSLVDKGVTNGKYYVYSIRAINGTGYSAFDTSKTDTIQPITAPTAKVVNKSNGVQVSWNSVSGVTKYNVYRRLGGTSTWIYVGQTTSATLLDTGVVKGKSYAYSIRAINGTGYSAYDSSKCAAIKYT